MMDSGRIEDCPVSVGASMNFDEAQSYLLGLGHETLAIKLGLAKTELLLDALGNPQHSFRKVQIAGTNGKGSTAAFLDHICRAANIRTGLYTSPHLSSITERIRIDGEPIAEHEFARVVSRVRDYAQELIATGAIETPPTFFEHVTLAAICAFADAKVDLVILETGLGGRLDATTAAQAELVAITPIDIDHQEYLGNDLRQIAAEKAAIIREGTTAVIAPQQTEAISVIRDRAKVVGAELILLNEAEWHSTFTTPDGRFEASFEYQGESLDKVLLGLRGRHQLTNAATAVATAAELRKSGFSIEKSAVRTGLEGARHPGRLELLEGTPPVLLDGAHNTQGAHALANYLREFVTGPITLTFGAMQDKDVKLMLEELVPVVSKIVFTQASNIRSATLEQLTASLPPNASLLDIEATRLPVEALEMARKITPEGGTICVAGSLYLVGEVREMLIVSIQVREK
jgi:dihydrofolate synthase / folylpolyglutamate synthase